MKKQCSLSETPLFRVYDKTLQRLEFSFRFIDLLQIVLQISIFLPNFVTKLHICNDFSDLTALRRKLLKPITVQRMSIATLQHHIT